MYGPTEVGSTIQLPNATATFAGCWNLRVRSGELHSGLAIKRIVPYLILLAILLDATSALGDPLSPDGNIRLEAFDRIHLPIEPLAAERSMADVLQVHLRDLYDIELTIAIGQPDEGQRAILLGRRMAVAAGTITEEELEAVKYDGYVIKCYIALAGYASQGTIYATVS